MEMYVSSVCQERRNQSTAVFFNFYLYKVSNEPANNPYLIGKNLGMSNWHHKRGRGGGNETVHWPHLGEWEPIFAVTQVYNSPACLHRK